MAVRKLPIGIQDYPRIRQEGYLQDLLPRLASTLSVSLDTLFGMEPSEKAILAEPKRSSREGKLLDVFRVLPAAQQRALVQQAEGLLLRKGRG